MKNQGNIYKDLGFLKEKFMKSYHQRLLGMHNSVKINSKKYWQGSIPMNHRCKKLFRKINQKENSIHQIKTKLIVLQN